MKIKAINRFTDREIVIVGFVGKDTDTRAVCVDAVGQLSVTHINHLKVCDDDIANYILIG